METVMGLLVLCVGLLVRLALPVLATLVLVYFLRKLDARWQMEADHELPSVQNPNAGRSEVVCPKNVKTV